MSEPVKKEILQRAKNILDEYLNDQGLRKTSERYAVLEEIYRLPQDEHIDVESLFLKMRNNEYTISRATVYNSIDLLVDCGLVVKHNFKDKNALYEPALTYEHHDHLVCNSCLKIKEFLDPDIENIKKRVGKSLGSAINLHSLVFYGDCTITNCENLERKKVGSEA
ncbi:transcriptional repressor [Marivirga atlantica]|jgi:Fur family ferric uptake transcriptional regulator|uniref:Ferric uptake regulation protein n=1 Tax=Marivirga atlantica TaxID=1548457 RepID=A0A937ACV9_9BACT|nr:transcriptional repressor [Marivirga atlantica]MBL0764341.1 transcriptional repressor [Marivirga atlantica]